MNWKLKELLHRPICWIKGHTPTLLEDDDTVYCERCGKVLYSLEEHRKELVEDVVWKPVEPARQAAQDVMTKTIELLEREERNKWLPKPTARRRTRDRTHLPPAERHRDAISRHMKGKGRQSKYYRQSIKKSPHIKIEEED